MTIVKAGQTRRPQGRAMHPVENAAPMENRWSVRRLALTIYPLAFGAVAINLFFLGLMSRGVGLSGVSPHTALLLALPLGVPVAWAFARRLRGWIDSAQ